MTDEEKAAGEAKATGSAIGDCSGCGEVIFANEEYVVETIGGFIRMTHGHCFQLVAIAECTDCGTVLYNGQSIVRILGDSYCVYCGMPSARLKKAIDRWKRGWSN